MAENDEREDLVLDLSIEENNMQRIQVSISKCDNEKQNEIFVQVSEKSSFNNSVINDNLISMSCEDDQRCFQILED